jgi:hypothetical protein
MLDVACQQQRPRFLNEGAMSDFGELTVSGRAEWHALSVAVQIASYLKVELKVKSSL